AAGDVFPGQPLYFAEPYLSANGLSFDYDCSESEEAEPSPEFVPAPSDCEQRQGPLCGGDTGYINSTNIRSGTSVNPLCGSREQRLCGSASRTECLLVPQTADAPFPCH
ncbi:MAG: hypothetical protein RL685_6863, partial [Pseudomonadota bacterium]